MAALSLITVLAGMLALAARTAATVIGLAAVAAEAASLTTAGGEMATLELFLVEIVGDAKLVVATGFVVSVGVTGLAAEVFR